MPEWRARSRRRALALLGLVVIVGHALLAQWWAAQLPVLGASSGERGVQRLKANFVAELRPAAPPPQAPRPAPAPRRRAVAATAATAAASAASVPASMAEAASPPAAAASLPEATDTARLDAPPAPAASSPEPVAAPAIEPPEPDSRSVLAGPPLLPPSAATATEDAASGAAPVAVAEAPAFEWPRSTRLSYRLTGYFRGPVDGQASVEWLREGTRYQVHVEVSVGPSFAPLLSRRMSSDGDIGADGLSPRRYEEETRAALRTPRRLAVLFGEGFVRLPSGAELPRPAGVQDSASQFVQLTWLFTTQPQRLRTGESIPLMLALPRRIDTWVYDVLMQETLATGAGPVEAVHVRPRRPARPGGDLTAEMWVAPSLQYLPVRIVIRQDADTYVDLLLEQLPRQAAAGR